MVNAQEWLDKNYPKEERNEITELRVRRKKLEGYLNLQDFVNLEFLDCSQNQLTGLDLSKNTKLEVVKIYDNQISCADYAKIDIFSQLINLQKLDLGYNTDKQEQETKKNLTIAQLIQELGRYPEGQGEVVIFQMKTNERKESESHNNFLGSLEMLKNCQNLKELSIEGQKNITGKLEDLPPSVETFDCKGTSFQEELEGFGHNRNLEILKLARKIGKLETEIEKEREIHQDSMKAMDNFYQQNPPREDLTLQNILKEISDDYLDLNRENKQLKEEIKSLKNQLELTEKLVELQNREQQAQILQTNLPSSSQGGNK